MGVGFGVGVESPENGVNVGVGVGVASMGVLVGVPANGVFVGVALIGVFVGVPMVAVGVGGNGVDPIPVVGVGDCPGVPPGTGVCGGRGVGKGTVGRSVGVEVATAKDPFGSVGEELQAPIQPAAMRTTASASRRLDVSALTPSSGREAFASCAGVLANGEPSVHEALAPAPQSGGSHEAAAPELPGPKP
jgi:hypothetical protein